MVSFKDRMAKCYGLPERVALPVSPPHMIIVTRGYSLGRDIVNIDELVDHIRSKYDVDAEVYRWAPSSEYRKLHYTLIVDEQHNCKRFTHTTQHTQPHMRHRRCKTWQG